MQLILDVACRLSGLPTIQQLDVQLRAQQAQLQARNEQQRALNRVISKVRASLDVETIFRTTTKETCKLLRVERVAVYRFFEDWGGEFVSDFEFAEAEWDDLESLGRSTVWNDTYLQEHKGGRYRHNEPLVVSDVYTANLSQCHLDILAQFHIRAYATAPIFIGQKLWGVLAAYQHSQPYDWQDVEIQFLMQVAAHLGFAVKQAELLAQAEQRAEELEAAYRQQQVLFNLITEIRETIDLDTLFKTTVREMRKTLQADRVGIFRFDVDSHYNSGQFVAEHVLPAYDSAIATSIQDHCFGQDYAVPYEQGRMQVVADVYNAGLKECHLHLLEQFQVRAQVVTPLTKRGVLWGLLCVHQCSHPRDWRPAEVQFIKQLTAQFSVALEHAELLTQYRSQADHLDQALRELKQTNAKLERLMNLDALTQVANRRCFDDVLQTEWRRLQRSGHTLSLILFDIDYFKVYNDRYGHLAGDTCLFNIAQAAQSVLKRPTDLLARYGGEEFAVILPETDETGAIEVARKIQAAIADLKISHLTEAAQPFVTVSLGIASQVPTPGVTVETLIARADKVLYQAKEQGRNRWICAEA